MHSSKITYLYNICTYLCKCHKLGRDMIGMNPKVRLQQFKCIIEESSMAIEYSNQMLNGLRHDSIYSCIVTSHNHQGQ